MHGLLPYEQLLFDIHVGALVGVLIRFLTLGLSRVYKFFVTYITVLLLQSMIPIFVKMDTSLYGYLFLATETVVVVLYALVVLELYSIVLRDLHGIATVARRYIRIAVGIAILISALLLGFEQTPANLLARFYTFESAIVSSLVLFVFLITAFLVYFPIPLSRNVIYYSIGYAVYFTSKALALFLRNTGHTWDRQFSVAMLCVATACLIFWIFALSAKGETKTVQLGHKWNREDEERLQQQIEAINASLLRARK